MMPAVSVIILHPDAAPGAGPLARLLAEARAVVAEEQRRAFRSLGAHDVRLIAGPPDELPFGRRLAGLVSPLDREGLVVLGSGAVPLARPGDLGPFVDTAGRRDRVALANNRFSADMVAIARAAELPPIPDLPGDNALPRWLAERAGWQVRDLGARWRLQVDLDSPLDLLLATGHSSCPPRLRELAATAGDRLASVRDRLRAVRSVIADRRAELVVAGRTSATTLRWLERRTPCRVRALVEERGLRAASPRAQREDHGAARSEASARPPRSVLGILLDRTGPEALGSLLSELGEAALVDTRVLLAHRLGADERAWPPPEDRFASDLLDPPSIADPWLRALTAAAVAAPIPILLGGHTLVGPGVRLVAGSGLRPGPRRTG